MTDNKEPKINSWDDLAPARGIANALGITGLAVLLIIVAVILSACGTTGTAPVRTVEVNKPVAVSCVPPGFTRKTDYPDQDAQLRLAPNADTRYQLMQVGREERIREDAREWTVIEGCRNAPGGLSTPSK